ncbi:hypothetical protein PIB30_038943, partial [Stylosanthes scabra]|nr:hypothetical protein [Stylosanthes scabra]
LGTAWKKAVGNDKRPSVMIKDCQNQGASGKKVIDGQTVDKQSQTNPAMWCQTCEG